jgi:hypothetical protein
MFAKKILAVAEGLYAQGDYSTARDILKLCIEEDWSDFAARALLAKNLLAQGAGDEALIEAKLALQIGSEEANVPAEELGKFCQDFEDLHLQKQNDLEEERRAIKAFETIEDGRPSTPAGKTWETEEEKFQIHRAISPYFGLPEKPYIFNNNNYGFRYEMDKEPIDYPYVPKEDEVIIAIYGGSVASQFYKDMVDFMEERLSNSFSSSGRRAKILQFAMGAGKQPIQLFYLSYFQAIGQKFDVVVNLDGFNDVRNAIVNEEHGHFHAMPWWLITSSLDALGSLPDLDEASLNYYLELLKVRRKIQAQETDSRLGQIFTSVERLKQRELDLLQNPPDRSRDGSLIEYIPTEPKSFLNIPEEERGELVQAVVKTWFECARFMNLICSASQTSYIHALQPNHFMCNKNLTELERAWIEYSPKEHQSLRTSRAIIETCYPLMIQALPNLAAEGAHVCDLIDVFDNIEEQIFSDADCHFNARGHQLMAERLCDSIISLDL